MRVDLSLVLLELLCPPKFDHAQSAPEGDIVFDKRWRHPLSKL
jgi:hypothetical protein